MTRNVELTADFDVVTGPAQTPISHPEALKKTQLQLTETLANQPGGNDESDTQQSI